MPGEYNQLDKDVWKEIPERHVHKSGNVYVGKDFFKKYEVRVFVREINKEWASRMSISKSLKMLQIHVDQLKEANLSDNVYDYNDVYVKDVLYAMRRHIADVEQEIDTQLRKERLEVKIWKNYT